ncbi:MAG: helix-turn-helix transcriptional regulator [Bacteroidaceae bacterium]|nr:helix-turn-helix transcriptional regulator [Bacteroidaceae bacterium]
MKSIDIKGFRKTNNLTQSDLADYLGCSKAFISSVENGNRPLPLDMLSKLVDNMLNWDVSMLPQTSRGDNTIQVTGTNVDMRNINQSKGGDDARRIKELEQRVAELTEDKKRLQDMIAKLLEKI